MSDEEYEYDYGSDAEYDYGSDQDMNEDNGNSELIEVENSFYGNGYFSCGHIMEIKLTPVLISYL